MTEHETRGDMDREEGQVHTPASGAVPAAGPRRSILRWLIYAGILVIVCVVVAVIAWQVMRSSRSTPIAVDIYPGAQLHQEDSAERTDRREYRTSATVRDVYEFYVARIGSTETRYCRMFEDTTAPGVTFARCVIDNSQDDITQDVQITIAPADDGVMTQIRIERRWGGG
jgi:hypothetical protein